jgi:hypothetical protein
MTFLSTIILAKGESLNRLSYDEINSHDKIVWCNIHNDLDEDKIPSRVDTIYLRQPSFVNDLPEKNKEHLTNLKVKKIFSSGENFESVLNYKVINKKLKRNYGFNPSTGLIALDNECKSQPKKITIAGLDLFEKNKPLYYHDLNKTLTSNKNLDGLKSISKDNIVKKEIHSVKNTINKIHSIIVKNPNIIFVFYTNSDVLKNKIKDLKNVIIK